MAISRVYYTLRDPKALPERKSQVAAGWDLKYCGEDQIEIRPGIRSLIPTGLSIACDRYTFGKIEGRSGLALNHGIIVLGGVIDSDYRGEVKVILFNSDQRDSFFVKPFDRIAQIIFHEIDPIGVSLNNVDSLPESERGAFGFGSTGV